MAPARRDGIDEPAPDEARAAAEAGLRYVSDEQPGIRRVRCGRGFRYVAPDGRTVADPGERARLKALAVPPAWTDVWLAPEPDSHILATGRDAKGRKQYRYHPAWREVRDLAKFDRMARFGAVLPALRRHIDRELRRPGLPEPKVLALVVRLLDETLIRIGNSEYADANESYGLTTLRSDDVEVDGSTVVFDFTAKGDTPCRVLVRDPRLARVVAACDDLDGDVVFSYADEAGGSRDVTSTDVNEFLREAAGDVTAKDFRTWGGTVAATSALIEAGPAGSDGGVQQAVRDALDSAAEALGNTRTVARDAYVCPAVLDAYEDGRLFDLWRASRRTRWMRREERVVLKAATG